MRERIFTVARRLGTFHHWGLLLAVAIIVAAWAGRQALYGDPRLSIGTPDTPSYIASSRVPLFSWADLTGRRLFTTNLLYRLVPKDPSCSSIQLSMPAAGKEKQRGILPCVSSIALLQVVLSMIGWIGLALLFSRQLHTWLAKTLAVFIIVLFALGPQIAEWDSVLGSESLSLSLFALSFGLLIHIAFQIAAGKPISRWSSNSLLAAWLIVFALWAFARDANLYAAVVTLGLMLPILVLKSGPARRQLIVLAAALAVLLVLGVASSRQSPRWPPSITHSYEDYILPYPARIQFLKDTFGMPDPDSQQFADWFSRRSPTAFTTFLVMHPGFVASTILSNPVVFTHSYVQPYYQLPDQGLTSALEYASEVLHPNSGVFYLADIILLASLWAAAARRRDASFVVWAWLLSWLYFTSLLTLFVSYFGDTAGIMRHVFPSLEFLRLFLWLSILVHIDHFVGASHAAGSDSIGAIRASETESD